MIITFDSLSPKVKLFLSLQSSVHPLIPLLHYSSRHFPPSSPYSQPIRATADRQADAQSRTPRCYHGDSATVWVCDGFWLNLDDFRGSNTAENISTDTTVLGVGDIVPLLLTLFVSHLSKQILHRVLQQTQIYIHINVRIKEAGKKKSNNGLKR